MLAANLVNQAILRQHCAAPGLELAVRQKSFPTPFKCNRDAFLDGEITDEELNCDLLSFVNRVSLLDYLAMLFMPYMFMMSDFFFTSPLVYEKQAGLRQQMTRQGLGAIAYWATNYGVFFVQYIGMQVLFMVMASVAGMRFYQVHSSGVMWSFLLMWGLLQIALVFVESTWYKSTRTSTSVSFLLMLIYVSVGGQIIFLLLQDPDSSEDLYTPLMIFPPLVMLRVLYYLLLAAGNNESVTFANWHEKGQGVVPYCLNIMPVNILQNTF